MQKFIFFLTLFSPLVAAQQGASPLIQTLEEALKGAYLNNVDLAAQRVALLRKGEEIHLAEAKWRPELSIEGEGDLRQQKDHHTSFGVNGTFKDKESHHRKNAQMMLRARQNLYAGGEHINHLRMAKEDFLSAQFALHKREQDVFLEVINLYSTVMYLQERVGLEKRSQSDLEEVLAQTKAGFAAGNQRSPDVATAEARLANAQIEVTRAQAELEVARRRLQTLVGKPLAGRLMAIKPYGDLPKKMSELVEKAFKNNPSLLGAQHDHLASRYNAKRAVAGFLPRIELIAQGGPTLTTHGQRSRERGAFHDSRHRQGEAEVRLNLSVPLSTSGESQSRYRTAELQVKEARLRIELQRRQLEEQCHTASASFEASQKNYLASKEALKANQTALDAARAEYRLGMISLLEVMRIEEYWLSASRQYLASLRELIKSSYDILGLMGHLTAKHLKLKVPLTNPYAGYDSKAWFSLGPDHEHSPLFPSEK